MRAIWTERRIPAGSIKMTRKDAPGAVVYVIFKEGNIQALAYQGKRNKPDFNYIFTRGNRRAACESHVRDFFDGVARSAAYKATVLRKKAESLANGQQLKPGDLLCYSWGYDQTNVDFYQVISRTARKVTIRAIKSSYTATGDMSGRERALPNQFVESAPEMTKLEQFSPDGKPFLSMDFGCATLTTPEKDHYSSSYA